MAQSKILVDTNCYLRLAKPLQPFLFEPFGAAEYCLYVIPELNAELGAGHLKTKFPWIDQPEFAEERRHFPTMSRKQRRAIEETFLFVWDHVETSLPGPSRVDVRYVAYALELRIPVVTDDEDMIQLAKALGVVARAKGMIELARQTGLSREQLYRSFSEQGNPTLKTLLTVTRALGVDLPTRSHEPAA